MWGRTEALRAPSPQPLSPTFQFNSQKYGPIVPPLIHPTKRTPDEDNGYSSDSSGAIVGTHICQRINAFLCDLTEAANISVYCTLFNVDADGNCGYYALQRAMRKWFEKYAPNRLEFDEGLKGELQESYEGVMCFRQGLWQWMLDNRATILGLGGNSCVLDSMGVHNRNFHQKEFANQEELAEDIKKHPEKYFETDVKGELAQRFESLLTRVWSAKYFQVKKKFVKKHFWFQPHLLLPMVALKYRMSLFMVDGIGFQRTKTRSYYFFYRPDGSVQCHSYMNSCRVPPEKCATIWYDGESHFQEMVIKDDFVDFSPEPVFDESSIGKTSTPKRSNVTKLLNQQPQPPHNIQIDSANENVEEESYSKVSCFSGGLVSSKPKPIKNLIRSKPLPMTRKKRAGCHALSLPTKKPRLRHHCVACIEKWNVAMCRSSILPGSGKVNAPKINRARREGMLCDRCYNEKTGEGNAPKTDEEKAERRQKEKVYRRRRRRQIHYERIAKSLGLLEKPKQIKFWEGNDVTGNWMVGEQLCNEGMIDLYKGQGEVVREGGIQGVIVRVIQGLSVMTIPVESSLIKPQGKHTVLVGKSEQPADRLTGRVLFPNSTECKVRISWFGAREEWMVESQMVFSEEVNATERKKKEPERLMVLQQQATEGQVLQESVDENRKWEKKNEQYFESMYDLIDFGIVGKAAMKTDLSLLEIPDETKIISTALAKGQYNLAYKSLSALQNEADRKKKLTKEAEKAMKQEGIVRPNKNKKSNHQLALADNDYWSQMKEYERVRGGYEERLDGEVCVPDRRFIDDDKNLEMFQVCAMFDMLRLDIPTFILPGHSIRSSEMILSLSYCFVCIRVGVANDSHKEGLCKDCFHSKYDKKLCVDCVKNQSRYKGGLCQVCYVKRGNKIEKPKCVLQGCNSIAKRRGGLCETCYKRKGNDNTAEQSLKESGKNEQSLKESGKKYNNCIVCLKNGITKSARRKGSLCRKCYWEKSSVRCKVCNGAGSDGMWSARLKGSLCYKCYWDKK